MARIPRIVLEHVPHHVTQRGNRRQQTFFIEDDYRAYLDYLVEGCQRSSTSIWAYCLMPNHVHLLLYPTSKDGLRAAIADAHRKYTRRINLRENWRGHLWQERFASFPTDENHTFTAARYIELNPVRAGIVSKPEDYRWSSASAHITGKSDGITDVDKLLSLIPDWSSFLASEGDLDRQDNLRLHERTGRPLGSEKFITEIETALDRVIAQQKRGPKG